MINHRSTRTTFWSVNALQVHLSFLRVGEWARVWPLNHLFKCSAATSEEALREQLYQPSFSSSPDITRTA